MAPVNPFPNPFPASTAQLAYVNDPSQPLPGTPADKAEVQDFITGVFPAGYAIFGCVLVNDPAVATGPATGAGAGTIAGGIGQGCKHPVSAAEVAAGVLGFAVRTAAMETRRDTYPPSYQPGDMVNIMRAGRIWTKSECDVTQHDPVYVRQTANGALSTLGAVRNDADTVAATIVPGARFMNTALAGEPVRIEFNLIGQ